MCFSWIIFISLFLAFSIRKQTDLQKKEAPLYKKPHLNHTEYAYREAVNRLKCMLADSYTTCKLNNRRHGYESDDTDNISVILISCETVKNIENLIDDLLVAIQVIERPALSEISKYIPSTYHSTRRYYTPSTYGTENDPTAALKTADSIASLQPTHYAPPVATSQAIVQPPPELLQFIEKQEGYIEQLERESQFCRVSHCLDSRITSHLRPTLMLCSSQGELSNILGKVKDVISENEVLTEQAKIGHVQSDTSESGSNDYEYRGISKERYNKVPLSGPNIVFESRISELEAQLAQADIDIKRLTQENNSHKQRTAINVDDSCGVDVYKRQIEILQRYILLLLYKIVTQIQLN